MWKTIKFSFSILMFCFFLVSCVSDESNPSRPSLNNYQIDQVKTFKIGYEDNLFKEKIVFSNFNSDADFTLSGEYKNLTLVAHGEVKNVGYISENNFEIDPNASTFWQNINFKHVIEIDELDYQSNYFRFENPHHSKNTIETGEKFVIFEFQPSYTNVLLLVLMRIELIENSEFLVTIKILDKQNTK